RTDSAIGVLIIVEEPTKPMVTEAAGAGFCTSGFNGQKFPGVQLSTIGQILAGIAALNGLWRELFVLWTVPGDRFSECADGNMPVMGRGKEAARILLWKLQSGRMRLSQHSGGPLRTSPFP
ncbi:MAG: hypothetical protein ABI318_14860, partial [Chthoniobacteraceae bacterium]